MGKGLRPPPGRLQREGWGFATWGFEFLGFRAEDLGA